MRAGKHCAQIRKLKDCDCRQNKEPCGACIMSPKAPDDSNIGTAPYPTLIDSDRNSNHVNPVAFEEEIEETSCPLNKNTNKNSAKIKNQINLTMKNCCFTF